MKKEKGELDYDYKYDILLFKAAERPYSKSIELDNIMIHFDNEKHIMGIEIFEASKFLKLNKKDLLKIINWQFEASTYKGSIEINLLFKVQIRNKIVEKNPIIKQSLSASIPDSELVCGS